jgi:hypothetical protein
LRDLPCSPLWSSLANQKQLSARFEFGTVGSNTKKNTKPRKKCFCGGAEGSRGSDGDAAAKVAHAAKGGDGEEEENVDAAAALPHMVAPVGAPSLYSCSGAEERKGCDGGAAATFAHAVAAVGAPSAAAAGL